MLPVLFERKVALEHASELAIYQPGAGRAPGFVFLLATHRHAVSRWVPPPVCRAMRHRLFILFSILAASTMHAEPARIHGGYYTAERLANAHRNAAGSDWGRALRDQAVTQAQPWIERSDADLWSLVPGQDLGRCIDVTLDRRMAADKRLGCLVCGAKIFTFGSYPYNPDVAHQTWKLTCPSCGAVFPTNDFGRYYRSAIDEHGVFNPANGDRRLLFNAAHPDPKDPRHLFGVDDGFGFVDANGREHRFIGYYAWKHWMWLQGGLKALADAYVLTGDRRYAHKAAVLLDRIADVYPTIDFKPYADRGWFHSDANLGHGKIEGQIWETNVLRKLAEDYDAVLSGTEGDAELFAFLAQQGRRYQLPRPKGTRDLFVQNVDEGLLRCGFKAVAAGQICGNEGMHQLTVAACALALNTMPESARWLDWIFEANGGALPGLLTELLDRDGLSNEAAPGYAHFLGQCVAEVAFRLADYPPYDHHDVFREFPQLRRTFTAAARTAALGFAVPNLGDSGATGLISSGPISPAFMAKGFRYTHDPDAAVAAWRTNGNSSRGLGRDLFAADPEALGREIERLGSQAGPRPAEGDLLTGFGLALLESGRPDTNFALACNYGRTVHHGHLDQLNFDLLGFGCWLTPDLGYPEFATSWPSRDEWTINTLAHNTVSVDGAPQALGWGGRVRLFERLRGFKVVQLESSRAYPQMKEYGRTMLMIDAGTPAEAGVYVVDIFRAVGGRDHVYSFHGPPGVTMTSGLTLASQDTGTYAGPGVPFATPSGRFPKGYSYLYQVRRDPHPAASFTVDWAAEPGYRGSTQGEGMHLRLHALTPCEDVALAAGDPPQDRDDNPRRIDYALLHRTGTELESTFVTVIEPYRRSPFIKSVQRLPAASDGQVALRIELSNGMVDHVWFNPAESSAPLSAHDEGVSSGIGYVRESGGVPVAAALVNGRELVRGSVHLTSPGALRGRVVRMNRELTGGGWLCVDTRLPTDGSLTGHLLIVANNGERDAAYLIHGVAQEGGLTRIDCGPIAFVHGYRGPRATVRSERLPVDYGGGYEFDFEPGAAFTIPLGTAWNVGSGPTAPRRDSAR